ncbi:similar to cytochrome P450 alkane hydroxylase [Plenodomus lingam JN3]|uniref:Similar to cytochrome P450 alkane hydroxylase n=1 Tax=Leptosphaeria maculans (strain JN3 / isolate v23.1.3 / race Av1-4-5-6-7-8) TaxID=985895 RepID=E5A7X3_LEPMJ|nr:similar to cytochrome P450 alkane hydroxylase [Plenodomus lingam JN3]CBX99718.1 similar to cytochrome P450 alkane hydroxylase [Plenodomus lingam JN3]
MALSPLLVILTGAALSYLIYTRITLYRARQRFKKEHNCQPCTSVFHKDPILGLDAMRVMAYNSKHHITLQENKRRFEKYGNTFHNRIINTPLIATCEPENIKTMLSLRFKDYSFEHRQAGLGPLLGHGIFNAQGERWANSRQLLRPNFARDQVADLDAFERHFKLMMKHIPRDGTTVDLQDLFFMLTIDSATEFLFNHSTNTLRMAGNDDAHNEDVIFSKAFNFAQFDITKRMRLGPLDRFRSNEEGERAIKICHEYIDKFVEDALRFRKELDGEKKAGGEAKDEKYYFIQEVAKQTTDKKRIREELINILLAGRDTTASLLSNMFFELARRPEIWAKLREEVESLGGERPSYEQLRGLKYLKWCLNESLRTHPVVPNNSRLAACDTVLPRGGGPDGQAPLFVPKGTIMGYSVYTMHRRKDLYGPDADKYDPERWATLRPSWEYLPFNGGPRICLGQQYALTEASYVTVRMLQEFKAMESRDAEPWIEGLTLTLCSKNGVKVGLTPA